MRKRHTWQAAALLRYNAVSTSEEAGRALGLRLPPLRQLRKCLAAHLEHLAAMGMFSFSSVFLQSFCFFQGSLRRVCRLLLT